MNQPKEIKVNEEVYVRKSDIPKRPPIKLSALEDKNEHPYTIDEDWYIETATKYYIGTLVLVTKNELVLENAAWIPDTGRFSQFAAGTIQPVELEPCGDVPLVIGRGAIISAMPKPGIQIVTIIFNN